MLLPNNEQIIRASAARTVQTNTARDHQTICKKCPPSTILAPSNTHRMPRAVEVEGVPVLTVNPVDLQRKLNQFPLDHLCTKQELTDM